jgi:tetratricopeptide (TPR) repeat protein
MAVAMELRVPMAASRILAGTLLVYAACAWAFAQEAAQPPSQTPPSKAQRSGHHVQVAVEDLPPTELTEAETAIEKKDYAEAERRLHKLVQREDASYVAWFDLGFVENALGNVEASIAAYRKSVAAKPDVFESNLNLGLQLAKSGDHDAEGFLRAATKLKPTSRVAEGQYRAWLALGHTLEKSKAEEAIEAYQRAAVLQPKETEPHLAAGMLLESEHNAAEAEQEYKKAIAIDGKSSDATVALANLYMHGRRFPEAEDYLRKILAGHPDSAPVEIQLGRVLAAEGKNEEAISSLEAGIKLAPGDEGAHRDLAELYVTAGKNDLAEVEYRALVAAHVTNAELHQRLGQALLRQKKFSEAQQEFLTTVKLKPDLGEAYGDLAFAAGENKDYALVIHALDVRAKMLPEIPITYFMRASACDHLKDFKTAAVNYHLFLKTAGGKYPDQEWQAKHRLITIEPKK